MNKPKEQVVHVEYDVSYLPTPNKVEVVITSELAPADLTKTAFMVPVCDDGGIIIAVNQRRGLEIAGGHIESDETAEDAAFREAFEETGTTVSNVTPIGFLRMTSTADAPPARLRLSVPALVSAVLRRERGERRTLHRQ